MGQVCRDQAPNQTPSFNGCGPAQASSWILGAIPQGYGLASFAAGQPGCTTGVCGCNGHDVCYSTCNTDKATCDQKFASDIHKACMLAYPRSTSSGSSPPGGMSDQDERACCLSRADLYSKAVTGSQGQKAYDSAQQTVCECCCWPKAAAGAQIRPASMVPNQGLACYSTWSGTSSSLIAGVVPIDAQVTWDPDGKSHPSGVLGFVAIGTVSMHSWTNAQGCTVSYSPASYSLSVNDPAGNGVLTIDNNPSPPTYGGIAVTEWSASLTTACPDGTGGTVPTIAGGTWFSGSGSLDADLNSFQGTYTDPSLAQTFTYAFTVP